MRMSTLSGGEPAAIFQFGEFRFDCGSHLLQRNGDVLHLSPKAQQLLQMLLLNRPKAVSREEIYDALWPSTFVCETNMAGIVSELRHALGDDARSAQYIRTVHGFGYAFSGDVDTEDPEPLLVALLRCEGGRHPLFEGENTIGRSPDCQIVLAGATVSRRHAVIRIAGNTILLEDCGSSNGTYVNGKKIIRTRVRYQDQIAFGDVPAAISHRVSATLPLGLQIPPPRRHSSGSINTA